MGSFSQVQKPYSLIVSYVEGQEVIVQTHGFAAADAALAVVAENLRRIVRAADQVIRFGDCEFAILMCETTGEVAMGVANKVTAVRKGESILAAGLSLRIRCGASTVLLEDQHPEDILHRSVAALAEAHTGGKPECIFKTRKSNFGSNESGRNERM